jgi:hypothetical protein
MGSKTGEKTLKIIEPKLNIGEDLFPLEDCTINISYIDVQASWSRRDKAGQTIISAMGIARYKEHEKPERKLSGKSAVISGVISIKSVSLEIAIGSHTFEEGFSFDVAQESLKEIPAFS